MLPLLSDGVVSDVEAPRGSVLSPFLFTLYTTDSQSNSESAHLQSFSDESVVVGDGDGLQEEEDGP